jgi:uncharacterized membrane protein
LKDRQRHGSGDARPWFSGVNELGGEAHAFGLRMSAPRGKGRRCAGALVCCESVHKGRLEAFSDGVIAILITIMVLELKLPNGHDFAALVAILPRLCSYVLSFVFLGIYWSNHHHLLQAADRISGGILWANLHLLFWLSLVPFATEWMGETHAAPLPTAFYGLLLLLSGIAYYILQGLIIARQGQGSRLRAAVGRDLKGKLSPIGYAIAIPLAFVEPLAADAIYVAVALIWLVPDRRIETKLE